MEGRSNSIREETSQSSTYGLQCGAADIKRSSGGSLDLPSTDGNSSPSKIPRKFITNWRQACDRTKDRTKELLKKWRTVPNQEDGFPVEDTPPQKVEHPGWSVHVWTTWVSRLPSDESLSAMEGPVRDTSADALAPIQRDKLSHFFTYLLDHDRDGLIDKRDFELFSERLRRFSDWSWNSPEYLRLVEIEKGLMGSVYSQKRCTDDTDNHVDLDDWLCWWARMIAAPNCASYSELPLWVKALPRVFFLAINVSGNGKISKKELATFYGSVVGLDSDRINKSLDAAYNSMTSNGDHPLGWPQYKLIFANFLFARGPFGPGEHLLGMTDSCLLRGNTITFPIDYSAMNTPKDKLEVYNPHLKTNRHSVIV